MLPFNTFSIHDLLGFMAMGSLATLFLLIYWKLGRRKLDLLYALLILCCSLACLTEFMADNVVLQGQPAVDVPGAAQLTALWIRAGFCIGLAGMLVELHFVLRYCRSRGWLAKNLRWIYLLALAALPWTWTNLIEQQRLEPLAATSSWKVALPWAPNPGPLVIVFLALWLAEQVYVQVLLFRHRDRTAPTVACALTHTGLVRLAFLFQGVGVLVDVVSGASGWAGIAFFPVSSMLMAIVLGMSLMKERMDSEHEKRLMSAEMEMAGKVQQGLLPKTEPRVCGFDLAGWSKSASQAGGDIYDFFVLPDGRWAIALADASGHGMGSALVAAQTRALVRALATSTSRPDLLTVLNRSNDILTADLEAGNFVTCFLGFLDPLARELCFASAGQGPLVFYHARDDRFELLNATALPLAVAAGPGFAPALLRHVFGPGDILVLWSDGFYECADHTGEPFGIDRLLKILRRARGLPAAGIIARIRADFDGFLGDTAAMDDTTMVVIQPRLDPLPA